MRKNATPISAVTAAALAVAALAGGALLFRNQQSGPDTAPELRGNTPLPPANVPDQDRPIVAPVTRPQNAPGRKVTIYRVVTNDDGAFLEPITTLAPAGSDARIAAINDMAQRSDSPLPPGTRVRSLTVSDGVATIDFNRNFVDNFAGGETTEALTLNAITATLAHFPGIDRVQITVGGDKIDTLGGGQTLNEPLPVPRDKAAAGDARSVRSERP